MPDEYLTAKQQEESQPPKTITTAQKMKLLAIQDYGCAICQRKGNGLYLDHDHVTGLVRGYLCSSCNPRLGHYADSPNLLHAAGLFEYAAYLRHPVAAEWGIIALYRDTSNRVRRRQERWRREALEALGWGYSRRPPQNAQERRK